MTSTRERLLYAAADLLESGGREAVSTRAVCAAAGVKSPTLYRLFGDKETLLGAVAAHGFQEYLATKEALGETDDPLGDMRRGWDLHVDFGLAKPAFYTLMYGEVWPPVDSPAKRGTMELLQRRIARIGEAGLLAMSVKRAVQVFYAGNVGVVIALLSMPPELRDPALSATAREGVLRTITNSDSGSSPPSSASAPSSAWSPSSAPAASSLSSAPSSAPSGSSPSSLSSAPSSAPSGSSPSSLSSASPPPSPFPRATAGLAVALREALGRDDRVPLSAAERALLADWLDRVADAS